MKIEHWHCQHNYPTEQLNYDNLLGACMGNEGNGPSFQHCDTRKGNRDLSRNPANPDHRVEELVRYPGDGSIVSDDAGFNAELNDILNLNHPFLKRNRKATLDAFMEAIDKHGSIPLTKLERWLQEWSGGSTTGELQPFCQVVVCWLTKKLARAARH